MFSDAAPMVRDDVSCDPVALVAAIRGGDTGSEDQLVKVYGRAIAIILDRHTNGRPEAEDLYQDTFCIALQKIRQGELREPAKLPGFLSQTARYLAIDYYRKAGRRQTNPDSEAVNREVAAHPNPLDELLAHERAALARKVIAELRNPRDREILFRFYIAEEDKASITADLGLTSGQFNRVLHRARQRYRALYLQRRQSTLSGVVATLAQVITLLQMGIGV
jgi:RNA polymerase sigma-70 factor (ECF subfamily)